MGVVMSSCRCSLLLWLGLLVGGFSLLPSQACIHRNNILDGNWKNHPVLAEPDGQSHRGGKMVAADINDPRVLAELIRRFRQTTPLELVEQGDTIDVRGAEDFEKRQEFFLRLLDYYWFSKPRLIGMTWVEVDKIFGPLGPVAKGASISAGRDTLYLWFKEGRVHGAYYAMGY
ncbi:MAG TPA: hypothetical protein VH682_27325 [Gemmataceae bacterium]|jgi:hypothetical protein